jgi:hypothetical protein
LLSFVCSVQVALLLMLSSLQPVGNGFIASRLTAEMDVPWLRDQWMNAVRAA